MKADEASWKAQTRAWKMLNGLRPVSIDLRRIELIRKASLDELSDSKVLELLLQKLGLNDEGLNEFPPTLHAFCGEGLRLWQFPSQFSRYLIHLSALGIQSYLEIGVRHGGSFVATVEYLNRFSPLNKCIAIDIITCPSIAEYSHLNQNISFFSCNTQSSRFDNFLIENGPFDLVFIDSHHEEEQCRREYLSVKDHAAILAFHDVSNVDCPGVATVWKEVKANRNYECFEFLDQYEGRGPYMGIGLAITRSRTR